MPSTDIHPPFEAYKGSDPYVFVSYAHKDSATVFPELQELHQNSYRVWYDEGIDPGNEWPEEVAMALSRAAMFLVFISSNAVASQNVRNEINFAINNGKPFLAVYLTETELPIGLQLRMGDIQAIMKHRMSDQSYRRKMSKALPAILRSDPTDIGINRIVHHSSPFPIEHRERIARAIHHDYLKRFVYVNVDPRRSERASHRHWDYLDEFYRDSNRAQADDIPRKLGLIGCRCKMIDSVEHTDQVIMAFSASQVEEVAQREHDRWVAERESQGWGYGVMRENLLKLDPYMLKWTDPDPMKQLPDSEKDKDRDAVRCIPDYLNAGGYVIVAEAPLTELPQQTTQVSDP